MKYYIIAGEASGDLHAANLIKEIKILDSAAEIRGFGGDKMIEQGAELVMHYRDLDFMGFVEVIGNLKTVLKSIRICKNDINTVKPDAVILVDYPGFNLRIAAYVAKLKIPVFYYVSPQIWAWKQGRIRKIKKHVDTMLVILPFEKEFYSKFNYQVNYIGHPLLDAFENLNLPDRNTLIEKHNLSHKKEIIALLPGSRKQEIARILPEMLSVVAEFPNYQFVIAATNAINEKFYEKLIKNYPVSIVFNQTYALLKHAKAALVTSGTATLETALFNIPQVVCYSANALSYFIAKKIVKVKYISLVNLIMNKPVITELIQHNLNTKNLKDELLNITENRKKTELLLENYVEVKRMLGGKGASARAARIIINSIRESTDVEQV